MSERLVWAFKPLPDLNNETGFVTCDDALAARLLETGDVQDPAIGAHHFNEIQSAAAVEAEPVKVEPEKVEASEPAAQQADIYETKIVSPRKRASKAAE